MSNTYSKELTVSSEHIDDQNHVNNVVYLQWVQDIAKEHWDISSNPEVNDQYYWVVVDHYIKYLGQAFLGDQIIVKTYVERNEGVRSFRFVDIYRGDKLIVKTKTTWCLMHKEKNRPTRVPAEISALFGIVE